MNPCAGRIEITYISEGRLTLVSGDERFEVKRGDVFCNLYDKPIAIASDGYHCHHTVCFEVNHRFSDNVHGLYISDVISQCRGTEKIERIIDDFVFSQYLYDKSNTRAAIGFMNILGLIDEINRKSTAFIQPDYSLIAARAKKYIQKNIEKPITQREIAEFLGVSAGYLCNMFKKSEGITLIKYVNTIKLKNVQMLMQKEGLKLYEAALRFGYSDANYVSALYKKIFGRNITSLPDRGINFADFQ